MPPKEEGVDFEVLRRALDVDDHQAVVPGHQFSLLKRPMQRRIKRMFPDFFQTHNPFIRTIIRRSREYLEEQLDPETSEPILDRIAVQPFGETDEEAIPLPPYLKEAYDLAERFTKALGKRKRGMGGFMRTLLLRRMGSTIYAGQKTARKMLEEWETLADDWEEDDDEITENLTLTPQEREYLKAFLEALEANQEKDPKLAHVRAYLFDKVWWHKDERHRGWLKRGVIIFSQYRDSIQWLAEQLTTDEQLKDEPIVIYSGPQTSGLMLNGEWIPKSREELKQLVAAGEIRLMLGTDAASEGLNLQRLGALINLDLPWNPTRLEQRKGRIQRIGQVYDTIFVYNMRYRDSVEDRVHELLSERLEDIYGLFGQLPDVLKDAWVEVALGEQEEAKKIIDAVPKKHPFEIRYAKVEPIDWESCTHVLADEAKLDVLRKGW